MFHLAKSRAVSLRYVPPFNFLLLLILWVIDCFTGREIAFHIYYLAPVSLAAWISGPVWGTFFAFAGTAAWFTAETISGYAYTSVAVKFWNATAYLIFFMFAVLLLSKLKDTLARRDQLISELQEATKNLKTISGLLPICAWCKKIRDDQGYWTQVELYLAEHSNAEFTHCICPECKKEFQEKVAIPSEAVNLSDLKEFT